MKRDADTVELIKRDIISGSYRRSAFRTLKVQRVVSTLHYQFSTNDIRM